MFAAQISPSAFTQDPNSGSGTELNLRFNPESLKAYVECWPLLAACSIKPESRSAPFFPEYVVSQLLLQWVAQEDSLDGIRYFSTRTPSKGPHVLAHSNCVFPVKTIGVKGHCSKLKEKFALIEPLSWEMLTAIRLGGPSRGILGYSNSFAFIQMSEDILLNYAQTEFSNVEQQLKQLEEEEGKNYSRVMEP